MFLLIIILAAIFATAFWLGRRRVLRLEHLSKQLVINGFLLAMVILTLMTIANWMGIFPQVVAAKVTMGLYTIAGGFFFGYGSKLISLRKKAGAIEYIFRSFWTDVAPNIIAIGLVVYGIYRTGTMSWGPFTGIGVTSGLSLIGFGFFGWTVSIVPEFRNEGLLMLDQLVPWKKVVAYQWNSEEVLQIDYLTSDKKISEFATYIPPEDQLIIERLLGKKIREHEEERKQELQEHDEN